MTKPILAGFDPRHVEHAPVAFGAELAHVTRASLIVASVQSGPPHPQPAVVPFHPQPEMPVAVERDPDLVDDCSAAIEQIEAEVRAWGLRVDCLKLQDVNAARALRAAAEREDPAALAVGAGKTAERLLSDAPCPIAVVPRNWVLQGGVHSVGAAYEDSDEGRDALAAAYGLARLAGARLLVVHAGGDVPLETLGDDVPVEVETRPGDAADVLVALSEEVDVLVCGSRRYGPLRSAVAGSVSRRVAARAHCPVIVVPRGVEVSWRSAALPEGAASLRAGTAGSA
jgi:nucleotide-binding universal stress UspA family protein